MAPKAMNHPRSKSSTGYSYKMAESSRKKMSPILWNADTEVCLFYAMHGFKPVGINKHFHMMGIYCKFSETLGQPVTSAQLWEHLSTMYNLAVLDESDALPFDNKVTNFKLPNDILHFGKDTAKTKGAEVTESPKAMKSVIAKETNSTPIAKSSRKRAGTRSTATPSPGALGPGNKRKRY